jgi:hypothetical protein
MSVSGELRHFELLNRSTSPGWADVIWTFESCSSGPPLVPAGPCGPTPPAIVTIADELATVADTPAAVTVAEIGCDVTLALMSLIWLVPLAVRPFVAAAQTPQSPLAESLASRGAAPLTNATNRIL